MKHLIIGLIGCLLALSAASAQNRVKDPSDAPAAATTKAAKQKTASPNTDRTSAEKKKSRQAKKQKGSRANAATFVSGSEETASQRAARLTRECKGRPNAGACLGYAN